MSEKDKAQWIGLFVGAFTGICLTVFYGLLFFEPQIRADQKERTTAAVVDMVQEALAKRDAKQASLIMDAIKEARQEQPNPSPQRMLGDDGEYHAGPMLEE